MQVRLGRIDADVERPLLRAVLGEDVIVTQQLPIIALFTSKRTSKPLLFEGPHQRHAIVEFARKQLEPPTRTLTSVDEVDAFVRSPYFGDVDMPIEAVAVRRVSLQSHTLHAILGTCRVRRFS